MTNDSLINWLWIFLHLKISYTDPISQNLRRCCWLSPPFVACWVSTVRCRCQKTLGLGDYSPDSHLSGTFSKGKRAGCQNIGTSALILTQNMHRDSLSLLDTKIFWQFYQDWHAHDQFYHWQTKWTIRCTALLQTDVQQVKFFGWYDVVSQCAFSIIDLSLTQLAWVALTYNFVWPCQPTCKLIEWSSITCSQEKEIKMKRSVSAIWWQIEECGGGQVRLVILMAYVLRKWK